MCSEAEHLERGLPSEVGEKARFAIIPGVPGVLSAISILSELRGNPSAINRAIGVPASANNCEISLKPPYAKILQQIANREAEGAGMDFFIQKIIEPYDSTMVDKGKGGEYG